MRKHWKAITALIALLIAIPLIASLSGPDHSGLKQSIDRLDASFEDYKSAVDAAR